MVRLVPVLALALVLAGVAFAVLRTAGPAGGDLVGQPMPSLRVPGFVDGQNGLETDQLSGEPYLLNVYASWCTPCLVEHPLLMELAGRGVPLYAIAWKDGVLEAQAFLAEHGNPYGAVGFDQSGLAGKALGVQGAPETFVVDADGVVRAHWRGAITQEVLEQVIWPAWQGAQPDV